MEKSKRGRIENLKPFEKGKSGNPHGRPRKAPVSDALREILRDEKSLRRLAAAIFKQALKGNIAAFKEICERVEGRVANRVELSGAGGDPIEAKIEAKLTAGDLVGALRELYGLMPGTETERVTPAPRPQ